MLRYKSFPLTLKRRTIITGLVLILATAGFIASRYASSSLQGALSPSGSYHYFTPEESEAGITVVKGKFTVMSCAGRGFFPTMTNGLRNASGALTFWAHQYPRRTNQAGSFMYSEGKLRATPSLRPTNTLGQFERGSRYHVFTQEHDLTFQCGVGLSVIQTCGDGLVIGQEACDGGQNNEDGCSDQCQWNNECEDGVDNDGDTLIDVPRTVATLGYPPDPVQYKTIAISSYTPPDGDRIYMMMVRNSNGFTVIREILLSPLSLGRELVIPLNMTSANSGDQFSDGVFVVNPANQKAYVSVSNNDGQKFIARIDLPSMSHNPTVDLAPLALQDVNISTGVIDPQGRYAYFSTFINSGFNRIIKFDLSTFTRVGHIDVFGGENNRVGFLTSFMNPDGSYAYFGDTQGRLTRVNLATFAPPSSEDILQLTRADGGQNSLQVSAVALSGTEAYIVSVPRFVYAAPQKASEIYRIDLDDFSLIQTLVLHPYQGRIQALSIDPSNGNIFFSTLPDPLIFPVPSSVHGGVMELTPNLQSADSYTMDLAGYYVLDPIVILYHEGVRQMFAHFQYDPGHFMQYRIGGTDPGCTME